MNSIARFFSLGFEDADRRLAATLRRPPLDGADQYLSRSAIVKALDGATIRMQQWWMASETWRAVDFSQQRFANLDWSGRYRLIGAVMLIAVVSHVALTLFQGARPGWFWTVIPALATLFAAIVLIGSYRNER